MPCIKCSNGKYKYGQSGKCQHSKSKCAEIERAVHAAKNKKLTSKVEIEEGAQEK